MVSNLRMARTLLEQWNVHLFAALFDFLVKCHICIPANAAAVCRRVGGGFGGKATRPMPVAAACAVAAHKLGKQVRLSYNRNTDFRQNGGQPAVSFEQAV